ncbi:hypothetical protein Lesp02_23520 [Lentzea sp. NBRC 105346]|uniref:YncE family protein n=1 Tax=Lentzea sp. NBRC 105346 TaxID=3032205 RepID=UPI0024A2509C|nr:YncE family protein [Lentzea sp. NBRC 105346]GLZ30162.1 hypothetical protein Lesp02_23520 [Lentzea sp. NBRC 105346]
MTTEYRPVSRRTLLTAALGGAAAGIAGQSLIAGAAAAEQGPKLLVGTVDGLGNGLLLLSDPGLTGTPASLAVNGRPNDIAGTPDGLCAYVATQSGPGLSIVDIGARRVTGEIGVGGFANQAVVSPDGKVVYVASGSSGAGGSRGHVAVVDAANGEVKARIQAGLLPSHLAITPDGRRLFVGDERAKGVTVIDTAKQQVSGSFKTEKTPLQLAIDPKGKRLYVTTQRELVTFDLGTGNASGVTALEGRPGGLAVHPNGNFAVVSVHTGRTSPAALVVVNVNSGKVLTRWDNGRAYGPVALNHDGGTAFVLDQENRKATSADIATGKPDNSLPTPNSEKPTCVAFVETA